MGCSEIRPVTVQNREFPPLRPMYVLTLDNKVRLPQEVYSSNQAGRTKTVEGGGRTFGKK